jgi:hypothetical protein
MTSSLGRIYAIVLTVIVFFLAWAVIAARPWVETPEAKTDPRIAALNARERRLRKDAVEINAIVKKRWAVYRVALAKRKRQIAALKRAQKAQAARAAQAAQAAPVAAASPPIVRVVPAAPATSTRTS